MPEVLEKSETARAARIHAVDAATLKSWLDDGSALLVDVREPAEYAAEHIPGSVLLPLSSFDPNAISRADGVRVVLHCQTGVRSAQAAHKLLEAGFEEIWCYEAGLPGWRAAGLPTVEGPKPHLSVLRQTQLAIGTMIVLGTILAAKVSMGWLLLPGFMGCGLVMAGLTGRCPLAVAIARLPHNQGGCPTGHCGG